MPKTQCLVLAHICNCAAVHVCFFEHFQKIVFAFAAQLFFKVWRKIEIIFQCPLAPRSDKDEFCNACGARLINRILDQRAIHQCHNFFWHGFSCWQETCPHSCDGKDCCGDFIAHIFSKTSFSSYCSIQADLLLQLQQNGPQNITVSNFISFAA